jgi:hypothetical protein
MDISDQFITDNSMSAKFAQIFDKHKKRSIYANPAKQSEIQSVLNFKQSRWKTDNISDQTAISVQEFNRTNIWSVYERDQTIGLIGFLQLNNLGLYHYLNGSFDLNDPDINYLANSEKSTRATIFWFYSGKTRGVYGLVDVLSWLLACKDRHLDIWAESATEQEKTFFKSIGFQNYDHVLPGLMRYKRTKASLRH